MSTNIVVNGDLVVAKRKLDNTGWANVSSTEATEIELVVVGKPHDTTGRLRAVCQENQVAHCFDIDEYYIESNPSIHKRWLGWSACSIEPDKIVRVLHRPKMIGDSLSLSCSTLNGIIYRINQPNKGITIKEFEIIGRIFNKSAWQYEYVVKIPAGSTTGITLTASDLEEYNIEDTSLIGCLFQGVLTSEIAMSTTAPPRGLSCMNRYCRTFCPWVDDPNCPNGVFLCYSCKNNPVTYDIVMSKFPTVKE